MKTREGTYDGYILKEINRTYGWMDVEDKVVMDIGACFGAAAVFFAGKGAREVISYEPEPDNFRLLCENVDEFNSSNTGSKHPLFRLENVAISDKVGEISFYVNEEGINKGTHTIRPTRGRKEIKVQTLSFEEQLNLYRPEVLKIDCEGAEYTFLTKSLPKFVKQVCLEIHRTNKEYIDKAYEIVKLFKDWDVVKEPKLEGGHWATIGSWRRK